MNICKHCKSFDPIEPHNGICRLHPPRVSDALLARELDNAIGDTDAAIESTVWPVVFTDDWCNQYEATPHADNV